MKEKRGGTEKREPELSVLELNEHLHNNKIAILDF